MDNEHNTDRRKASLRGRGRDILLGRQRDDAARLDDTRERQRKPAETPRAAGPIDPASLTLSPEEADALLGFEPDDETFDFDLSIPPDFQHPSPDLLPEFEQPYSAEPDMPMGDWARDAGASAVQPASVDSAEFEDDVRDAALYSGLTAESADAVDARAAEPPAVLGDALPLAERSPNASGYVDAPYAPAEAVEALIPSSPELWTQDEVEHEGGAADTRSVGVPALAADTDTPILPEPFEPVGERPESTALFEGTRPADRDLLTMLVDDQRIRKLADQIDHLQEELAANPVGSRAAVDTFQKELLHASGLMLESRENYDDARAIVYRVWTDINRVRKTERDITRYRPLLLNYYIGWGVALGVLFLLKALFAGVTEAVGISSATAMYYPMLLGVAGALVSGLMTLERHTTRLRDFDPIHISWYLFNPLLGGVMGLLMFLLASIANEDLLRESASDAEHAITYLLCVVAGMNQNQVLGRLNDLMRRFGRSEDKED